MEIKFEHRLTEVEERSKSNQHRIEDIEKRQDNLEELTTTVRVLATREENVENTVKEIKEDVKTLTDKPAKRWDGLVDKTVLTITAAIIGFILAKLGLGV
jgi:predicted  nucleic acid-binding Zn-ribbon protein